MGNEGLVTTHKDESDARIKNVSRTPLGKEKIKIILQVTKPLIIFQNKRFIFLFKLQKNIA